MTYDALIYYVRKYVEFYPFLLPLGVIGVWRWGVWGIKKGIGLFYKPKKAGFKSSVSVVTPVYNENPNTFTKALDSWLANKPNEIIAVIDYTDKKCIAIFRSFARTHRLAKLITTKIPGKRPALAIGIKKAKSQLLALVDSDTIWGKDTLVNGIAPFRDKKIGGVATKQSLIEPKTIAQKLFSIRLEQRYWDDIPFLSTVGDILVCLSGRTAFYRKKAVMPVLANMINETFMGEKVISGEDKRLTYLIEAVGWKTTYQKTAKVYMIGEKKLSVFLSQQIRWTRNSWRADLKALYERWVFRSPIYTLYLIDRAIQPFTLLISPVFFVISLYLRLWIPVLTILVWWAISRSIKMIPHLRKYPRDIVILPVFILFNFASAYIRIYALLSVKTQGWITRWHRSRLPRLTFLETLPSHVATVFVFSLVVASVYFNKNQNYLIPQQKQRELVAKTLPKVASPSVSETSQTMQKKPDNNLESLLAKRHSFQLGESIWAIAERYGITGDNLLFANVQKITNWNRITPGINLTIPPKNIDLLPSYKFNYLRLYPDGLNIYYDAPTDQIILSGRGTIATFDDLAKSVGKEHLEEEEPGVWYLKSSLYLRSGMTLTISKNQVKWLRLASTDKKFARIFAYNSDVIVDGVKITSWDAAKKDYDKNYKNGRSYILVKDGSRLDINNSELAYLGYPRPQDSPYSTYGVSWRMSSGKAGTGILTGEITNSKFHSNYFGAYMYGATGMTWKGNEFYDNVRYGLDPHDDSNGFLVENNVFHDNGTHGLIFSKRCIGNTIRNNISYGNKYHGIMLHEKSNNNVIENNKVYDNHDGIALAHSSNNIIRNNSVYQNKRGVRVDQGSLNNLIEYNTISDNSQYGVYVYGKSDENAIENNTLSDNPTAVYVKSAGNRVMGNKLNKNEAGIYLTGNASKNRIAGNTITYSKDYGVYAKIAPQLSNFVGENNFIWRNKKDVFAYEVN